ncbi:hypothetical protein EDB80DRAFT_817697 [Ilyonectria destructans]|nr:hypothetical protein EDB80DRAFT_817697 [Ilyonectria destructans]
MRSRVLFSLALGLLAADSAVAGLCKPPQSSSSTEIISTTEAVSTTTSEAVVSSSSTESSSSVAPTATTNFRVVAGDGPLDGSVLTANPDTDTILLFNPTSSTYSSVTLTIEPDTGRLLQANGNYICAAYRTTSTDPGFLVSCSIERIPNTPYVLCGQPTDGSPLVCTAPAGDCSTSPCTRNGGTWNQFYTKPNSIGYFTYFGSGSYDASYTAVDFDVQVV